MLTAPLGAAAIAELVPHRGAMCLLDRALTWDTASILCSTDRHRDPANPLQRNGTLPVLCGLEFAFQAMALHGALSAGVAQRPGFVSSLREVALEVARLDDIPCELRIAATVLMAEANGFIYRFAVTAGERRLLHGQAAIILERQAAPA